MIYPAYQWGGGYTKSEVDTLLNSKANSSHTHSKSQITDFPSYGTTANTICEGNDSRLSDARTPTSHTHVKSEITDFPSLSTVATSGSYNDLSNKPTIPTVNNATLKIQKNGTDVKTFTANASSDVTCNITVPTKVSELTNDSVFITSNSLMYLNGTRANQDWSILAGSFTNNNNISTGRRSFTFPYAFSKAPTVIAVVVNDGGCYTMPVSNVGTTGFIAEIWEIESGNRHRTSNGVTINYIAIGKH